MRRFNSPRNTVELLCFILVIAFVCIYKIIILFLKGIYFCVGFVICVFSDRHKNLSDNSNTSEMTLDERRDTETLLNFSNPISSQECKDSSESGLCGINFEIIDNMDGLAFEHCVGSLLRNNGYENVEVTRSSCDFGVDIIAQKDGKRWAFQCKCYHSKLGVRSIQEVYSGAAKYGAEMAAVVTNSYFTPAAIQMATELSVQLWDREQLGKLINCISVGDNCQNKCELIESGTEESVNKSNINMNFALSQEDYNKMATILSAGKYVFGEDIPMGKYTLKVVSGKGALNIQTDDDGDYMWMPFGSTSDTANEYRNLSLKNGWFFSLEGNLQVEISKSRMLEIED